MNKLTKGNAGYLTHKKKIEIIKTIMFFGISIALYIMGYVTTKTNANLLTVVAILGCLPASKSAVLMIMFLKAKPCSKESEEHIEKNIGSLKGYYDLYFTAYDKNYPVSHMVITDNSVIGFTEYTKFDENAFEKHIQEMFQKDNIKDIVIKIFDDRNKYCKRLEELNNKETGTNEDIRTLLFSVSL